MFLVSSLGDSDHSKKPSAGKEIELILFIKQAHMFTEM